MVLDPSSPAPVLCKERRHLQRCWRIAIRTFARLLWIVFWCRSLLRRRLPQLGLFYARYPDDNPALSIPWRWVRLCRTSRARGSIHYRGRRLNLCSPHKHDRCTFLWCHIDYTVYQPDDTGSASTRFNLHHPGAISDHKPVCICRERSHPCSRVRHACIARTRPRWARGIAPSQVKLISQEDTRFVNGETSEPGPFDYETYSFDSLTSTASSVSVVRRCQFFKLARA